MPRFTQAFGRSGAVDASVEAQDLGKRLLGYLAEQRRLSGVPSQTVIRTASDGTIVRASFVGNLPHVEYMKPTTGRPHSSSKLLTLSGIAVRPRKAGTTSSSSDGQNAFGQNSHVIVRGSAGGDHPSWSTLYYNSANLPAGVEGKFYQQNPDDEYIFHNGIMGCGIAHWTNLDGSLSVNWDAKRGGVIPFSATTGGSRVYHNGIAILGSTVLPSGQRDVMCAAIRTYQGVDYLLVATSSASVLRIFRCKLHPDTTTVASGGTRPALAWIDDANKLLSPKVPDLQWPRYLPIIAAECELLIAYEPTFSGSGSSFYGTVSFNQSATELRSIIPIFQLGNFDADVRTDGRYQHIECIINLATPTVAGITSSQIDHGYSAIYRVDTATNSAFYANVANTVVAVETPTMPPFPAPDGVYPRTITYEYHADTPFFDSSNPSADIIAFAQTSSERVIRTPYQDAATGIPIVVQYQDDVPVYLWWGLGSEQHDSSFSSQISNTESLVVTSVDTVSGGFGSSVNSGTSARTMHADGSSSATTSWSGRQNRFWAIDKDGNRWFDVYEDFSGSGTSSATATMDRFTDDASDDGTFSSTRANSISGSREYLLLWNVDLKAKSIAYTKATSTEQYDRTIGITSSVTAGTPTRTTTNVSLQSQENVYHTEIWFYGVKVREFNSSHTAVPAVNNTSSTAASDLVTYSFVAQEGTAADAQPTTIAVSSSVFATLANTTRSVVYGSGPGSDTFTDAAFALVAALVPASPMAGPYDQSGSGPLPEVTALRTDEYPFYERFNASMTSDIGSIGGITAGNPPYRFLGSSSGGLSGIGVDAETQLGDGALQNTNFAAFDGHGRFIAHNGQFLYSMFDLDGRTNLAARQWKAEAGVIDRNNPGAFNPASIVSLDSITGARGAELHAQMWPVSSCVAQVKTVNS